MATRKPRAKDPAKDTPKPTALFDKEFNPQSMGATKVKLADLSPDEHGYQVQGYYASVRFSRGASAADSHMFGVTCCAFARDKAGKPYLKASGLPIEGAFTASCPKKDLLGNPDKVNEVRQAALDGALREMLAHVAENVAFETLAM